MARLDLPMAEGRNLLINPFVFDDIRKELEDFLCDCEGMNNLDFVKRILFNLEIKSNNTVEGINDDLQFIESVIKDADNIKDSEKRRRVINLYNGYRFILRNKIIDKEHLKSLYGILSDGLLSLEDSTRMGEYYREAPVYILKSGRLDLVPDQGLSSDVIDYYMDKYFAFVDSSVEGTPTDYFIKSQIMHFYFVYIHPYFDVNGRTSRTLAMWYLLNEKAYPYIIFNRAINFASSNYDRTIRNSKERRDVSSFIKFMMENVKKELEKEMIMGQIKQSTSEKMTAMDFQALNYLLSMNGEINVLNFATLYRDKNGFKKVKEIYEEVLRPLIEKDILLVTRTTKKHMFDSFDNEVLKINPKKYDGDNPKIRCLKL